MNAVLASPVTQLRHDADALAAGFPALMAEADRIALAVAQGVHGRRKPGTGETFWEYRPWRTEDGPRRVDWRRSARSDHWYVRENEWEAVQSIWLWRDGRPGMAWSSDRALPSKKDRATVLLMALTDLLTRGGERVGVIGESALARMGRSGHERVVQRLFSSVGTPEDLAAASLPSFAHLVLATDGLESPDVWQNRLSALAEARVKGVVLQIADPAEAEFPYKGRTRFEGPEGHDAPALFGRAQTARESYRTYYAAHMAHFRDSVRAAGWRFVHHRTDEPATHALLALYQVISGELV